jgi:hypothetical protein
MNQSKLGLGIILFCCSVAVSAHHSRFGVFDTQQMIDIQGTITGLKWANPHVLFEVDVTEGGVTQHWKIEGTAVSMLRSRGLDREYLHIGDTLGVAGHPTLNGAPEMLGTNLLLSDGTEVLMERDATPYFANVGSGQILESVFDEAVAERARSSADGIYRTWSTVLTDPTAFPMFKGRYPLNETSAEIKANWDPDPEQQNSCWAKAMPLLMVTPHPIEFSQQGENILMRFEEDDAQRLVHMNDESQVRSGSTPMGYSRGRWEGDTLIVETFNIDAEYFDDQGTPVGEDIRVVERFTLSEDQQRLDYRISFVDPETFTEPFDLTRYWVWRPERAVGPWDCVD